MAAAMEAHWGVADVVEAGLVLLSNLVEAEDYRVSMSTFNLLDVAVSQ